MLETTNKIINKTLWAKIQEIESTDGDCDDAERVEGELEPLKKAVVEQTYEAWTELRCSMSQLYEKAHLIESKMASLKERLEEAHEKMESLDAFPTDGKFPSSSVSSLGELQSTAVMFDLLCARYSRAVEVFENQVKTFRLL